MTRGPQRAPKVKYTCDICGFITHNKSAYNRHKNRINPCEPDKRHGTKRTTEQVKEDFKKVHGNRYLYDNFVYIDKDEPATMTCRCHGEFRMSPNNHQRGQNCPECARIHRARVKINKYRNMCITKFKEAHGDKYDYSQVVYKLGRQNVTIICPVVTNGKIHGPFLQTPENHWNGQGCPTCATIACAYSKRNTREGIIARFKERWPFEIYGYSYDKYVYVDYKCTPSIITCPKHGDFLQTASNHLDKRNVSGCYQCSMEFIGASKKQLEWLQYEQNKIEHYIQNHTSEKGEYKIPDVGKVDGYCHETNTVYEFHGTFWHGHPDFYDPNIVHPINKTKTYGTLYKETLARDEKIRNLGYKLVTIWEHEWNEINSEGLCQPCNTSSPS